MRLVDIGCDNCGALYEDVWNDEIPAVCGTCGSAAIRVVMLKPPAVDASEVVGGGGRIFSNRREMWKAARAEGAEPVAPKDYENLRKTTTEDRLAKKRGPLKAAVEKAFYRLKHGYQDAPTKSPIKENA
jgi:predicted  nucleic acid-binding Zn-ribbon protein